MNKREPARTTTRRAPRILIAGLLVVLTPITAILGYQLLGTSSSTAGSPIAVAPIPPRLPERPNGSLRLPTPSPSPVASPIVMELRTPHPPDSLPGTPSDAVGAADGVVPDGVTVFDDEYPAVANLNPALLSALRRAAMDAASDGVEFVVNSGWRSPTYQERLFQEAIAQYGSAAEAARWVDTPNTSAHVTGNAVDIGPSDATAWLSKHGAKYGLCQIYRNEPWHYELRPAAVDHGCPPMYADPTQDPRTQP